MEILLEAQKTEIGYQSFQDAKGYYVDEDFVEKNPDCWKIINFISDNPFSTQEEIAKRFDFSKNEFFFI